MHVSLISYENESQQSPVVRRVSQKLCPYGHSMHAVMAKLAGDYNSPTPQLPSILLQRKVTSVPQGPVHTSQIAASHLVAHHEVLNCPLAPEFSLRRSQLVNARLMKCAKIVLHHALLSEHRATQKASNSTAQEALLDSCMQGTGCRRRRAQCTMLGSLGGGLD